MNLKFIHTKNEMSRKSVQSGFTILETLVAIAILIIAITGPLAIVAQSLRSSYFSRDQITAYYLAQEAIEYVRNTRDTFGLDQENHSGTDWLDVLVDESSIPVSINTAGVYSNKYSLERNSTGYVLIGCTVNEDCPNIMLNRDILEGSPDDEALYGESTADEESIFIREIIFNEPVIGAGEADGEQALLRGLDVTVKVKWRMQDGSYSSGIVLKEYLTNWQLPNTAI